MCFHRNVCLYLHAVMLIWSKKYVAMLMYSNIGCCCCETDVLLTYFQTSIYLFSDIDMIHKAVLIRRRKYRQLVALAVWHMLQMKGKCMHENLHFFFSYEILLCVNTLEGKTKLNKQL